MQPSSPNGRKMRFALMPLAWGISFAVAYLALRILAAITFQDVRSLLATDSLLILIYMLPAWYFGYIVGLMSINLVALSMPPIRNIFDKESSETGRHGFYQAIRGLSAFAIGSAAVTFVGAAVYIVFQ